MSARDNNIFARWSRRKQAVRHGEALAPDEEQNTLKAAEADAEPVDQQPAAEEADAGAPLPSLPLPSLDDLTAESDLSAFLRKDVPKALKSAALRKMWSLDPTIREYIGPSEYAWDFNKPGSMAGFGPLDPKEAVVGFLSTIGRGMQADAAEGVAAAEPPRTQSAQQNWQPVAETPEQDAGASPDKANAGSPNESVEAQPTSASLQSSVTDRIEADAGQAKTAEPTEPSLIDVRQRHGGAMPR